MATSRGGRPRPRRRGRLVETGARRRYELVAEFSAEWRDGAWCGVSRCLVDNGRWRGQALGDPATDAALADEVCAFVFGERELERFARRLDVPGTCGAETCGVDVGVIRGAAGLELRLLERGDRAKYGF